MMAWIGSLAGLIFRTRVGSAAAALVVVTAGLSTWHSLDKGSAVKQAVVEYVARTELAAARAEATEARRRAEVAERATEALEARAEAAERDAEAFVQEIKAYEDQTTINPDGIVDGAILDRLRSR